MGQNLTAPVLRRPRTRRPLTVEKAIEVGIGLAEKAPNCPLCQGSRPGACPEHAASNVLRMLRENGYTVRRRVVPKRKPTAAERTLLTVTEAAAYLGVNRKTIRRRIDDDTLPAYRLGLRMLRVDQADLDRMLRPARASR